MPTRTFAAWADALPAARGYVADVLAGAPPQLCSTAALLVSELATNAVRHSGAREFTVRVDYLPAEERVWIGVSDTGPGQPLLQPAPQTAEHGRGLQLVSLLADRWGAHRRRATNEKTVWFELASAPGDIPTALRGAHADPKPTPDQHRTAERARDQDTATTRRSRT
jgi:anti-sigma regulatory factor (Ser/Thr protein kinase)